MVVSVKITWRMTEGNGGNNRKNSALTTVRVRSRKMAFGSYSSLQIWFFQWQHKILRKKNNNFMETYVSHWRNIIFSLLRFCSLNVAISCFDICHFLVQSVIDRCGGLKNRHCRFNLPTSSCLIWATDFFPLLPCSIAIYTPFLMWVLDAELLFPPLWEQASNHSNFLITFC